MQALQLRCWRTAARRATAATDRVLGDSKAAVQWGLPFLDRAYTVQRPVDEEAVALAEARDDTWAVVDDGNEALSSSSTVAPGLGFEDLPLGSRLASTGVVGDVPWRFETGHLARLADGACTLHAGATTVLATVESDESRGVWRDIPAKFTVDYRERLSAVGRIPGTYIKRELAPREGELLGARAIRRALAPLLPEGYPGQLQVTASVLSALPDADPEVMAVNAASAAVAVAGIPWSGPVGAVRVTLDAKDGRPRLARRDESSPTARGSAAGPRGAASSAPSTSIPTGRRALDLVIAATADGRVTMLDAVAPELSESDLIQALRFGVAAAAALAGPQSDLAAAAARRSPMTGATVGADPAAVARVKATAAGAVESALRETGLGRETRGATLAGVKAETMDRLRAAGAIRSEQLRVPGSGAVSPRDLDLAFAGMVRETLRHLATREGLRCDGRGLNDLRPFLAEPGCLPVVHGGATVNRGETQTLATVTVGGTADVQRMDTLFDPDVSKRLYAQYNLPDYSGDDDTESGIRKELDSAWFLEKALGVACPSSSEFPFTIRVQADSLSQNGGGTAVAVCAASLALAEASVPMTGLVAGVTVGLLVDTEQGEGLAESKRYAILLDPQALELSTGDMELTLAGTAQGLTAMKLSAKLVRGLPLELVEQALALARPARLQTLEAMHCALSVPAAAGVVAAEQAPSASPARHGMLKVEPRMIPRIIGSGGSTLRGLEESTGARVQVVDDGRVHVFGPTVDAYEAAAAAILDLTGQSFVPGQTYSVVVAELRDYGAMVELPGSNGRSLLHISELAHDRVGRVGDVLAVGDSLDVLCLGQDATGNTRLSRKALLPPPPGTAPGTEQDAAATQRSGPPFKRSHSAPAGVGPGGERRVRPPTRPPHAHGKRGHDGGPGGPPRPDRRPKPGE